MTRATCSLRSCTAARASRRKRSTISACDHGLGRRNFIATVCARRRCVRRDDHAHSPGAEDTRPTRYLPSMTSPSRTGAAGRLDTCAAFGAGCDQAVASRPRGRGLGDRAGSRTRPAPLRRTRRAGRRRAGSGPRRQSCPAIAGPAARARPRRRPRRTRDRAPGRRCCSRRALPATEPPDDALEEGPVEGTAAVTAIESDRSFPGTRVAPQNELREGVGLQGIARFVRREAARAGKDARHRRDNRDPNSRRPRRRPATTRPRPARREVPPGAPRTMGFRRWGRACNRANRRRRRAPGHVFGDVERRRHAGSGTPWERRTADRVDRARRLAWSGPQRRTLRYSRRGCLDRNGTSASPMMCPTSGCFRYAGSACVREGRATVP